MTTINAKAIESIDGLKRMRDVLGEAQQPLGFDIETGYDGPDREGASLDPNRAFIVGFSVTNDPRWARYVPLRHDNYPNLDPEIVWGIFGDLLTDKFEPGCVPHNAKFEKRFMRRVDIELNVKSDTIIEAFVLSEWQRIGLKPLTLATFGHKMTEISDLFPHLKGHKLKCLRFNELDLTPEVVAYACDDAAWALAHHKRNYPLVSQGARAFIYRVDMEIMEILCDVEDEGVEIDWEMLRLADAKAKSFNQKQHLEILNDLSTLTGRRVAININSSPQLAGVLYKELGYKATRKTGTGAASTDAVAMEALSKRHPVVKNILDFREVQALYKRYLQKWPKEFSGDPVDGRAHASINQTAVGTGRFAVSDPALQQCPKEHTYKLKSGETFCVNFRDAIHAPEDHYMLDFDYSQVELRVMAGLSQEETLIQAFNSGDDVHTITAAMMLGIPRSSVGPPERAVGKTMNFALLYGMGIRSLADRLAISQERAAELYSNYFNGFSSITTWMESMKDLGKQRRFTESKFGRKYTIWELHSDNPAIYSKGERVCVNAPVQGGAADYMKIAMVRLAKKLKALKLWRKGISLVMNNHDALTFYVHNSIEPAKAIAIIRSAVEFPVEGFPKIEAEFSIGQRWGSMSDCSEESEFRKPSSAADAPDDAEAHWSVRCEDCGGWDTHHDVDIHSGSKERETTAPYLGDPAEIAEGLSKMAMESTDPGEGEGPPDTPTASAESAPQRHPSPEDLEVAESEGTASYLRAVAEHAPHILDQAIDASKPFLCPGCEGAPGSGCMACGDFPTAHPGRARLWDLTGSGYRIVDGAPAPDTSLYEPSRVRDFAEQNLRFIRAGEDIATHVGSDEPTNGRAAATDDRRAAALTDLPTPTGKRLVLDLPVMPSTEQFKTILGLLARTGPNPYEIVTPDGSITGQHGTATSLSDGPQFSVIMPGAKLYHPASEVDASAFADITL